MKASLIGLVIVLGLLVAMFAVAVIQVEIELYKKRRKKK